MSRDFELLQRLEREWGRPLVNSEESPRIVHPLRQEARLNFSVDRTSGNQLPSEQLTPFARGELSRLLLGTYFSTPPLKSVMFSGVERNDGAKLIAACTADILAETGSGRVCLVDADLQSPTLHKLYSIPNQDGLSALLKEGGFSGAIVCASDNLWVVPAGIASTEKPLTAERFQQLASDLLESCDYLVIAAPSYEQCAETSAIGAATDGAVLVLDGEKTRRVKAQQAKSSLEAAKIRVLGSVLNSSNERLPDLLYARM